MKSVPPLVAPTKRHKQIEMPLIIPPKIAQSRISSVTKKPGIKSVARPETTIIKIDKIVKRLPIFFRQIKAGHRFKIHKNKLYGILIFRYFQKIF